jgi:DNA-binding transcriptional LysR family regulator
MDLRQLRQFVMLAETLNFHRAAERLNMAQPPLSVSIKKLEQEIGAQLFDRDRRNVKLTEAGYAILDDARRSLHHAAEIGRIARVAAAGESGRIKLSFAASATYNLLPALLPVYRYRYPNVKLELREGTNTEILTLLEAQEIDVGLVRVPTSFPRSIELVTIEHDVLVVAIPSANPLARRSKLTLADLAGEPFVNHASSGRVAGLHAATKRMFEQAGVAPDITQEALQVHTIISLVESGLGVALVPSVSARHASERIVFRHLDNPPPAATIGIALAYQPKHQSSATQRFRETALSVLSLRGPSLPGLQR